MRHRDDRLLLGAQDLNHHARLLPACVPRRSHVLTNEHTQTNMLYRAPGRERSCCMSTAEFAGRRALVTGGATRIGRAAAATLAARGARVAVADINLEGARRTAATIGAGAVGVGIDVRERTSVQRAFDEVLATLGGCDILIANAGVSTMRLALELTDEEWDQNFAVNSRGIFLTNQIAARHFVAQGKGVIVNTASLAAKVGAPYLAHYSASKFAVVGWTQALARELAAGQ